MTKEESISLFNSLHPDFFAQERILSIPEDEVFEEMILPLSEFDLDSYPKEFAGDVSFGFYEGDLETLQEVVAQVNPRWAGYFQSSKTIFCGFVQGRPVSFCLVEDMGAHQIGKKSARVGGPACVGTLRAYRNQGIGLTMVKLATAYLRAQGYDYSYIHFTGVAPWYARLGYRTCLKWTGSGILDERL